MIAAGYTSNGDELWRFQVTSPGNTDHRLIQGLTHFLMWIQ